MKLKANKVPYSGTVGGGLCLIDESGRARFMVAIYGTTEGITKEETVAIARALVDGIPAAGIDVPERVR